MASRLPGRRPLRAAMLVVATMAIGLAVAGGRSGADSDLVAPVRDVSGPLSSAGCTRDDEKRHTREFTLRLARPEGDRTALVRVPARAAASPSPLVVAFHGGGASGRFMKGYSGLAPVSDRAGFIAVFPDATGAQRFWNLDAAKGPDDVGFAEELIERVATVACVNPARVFAVGVSNGGGLAARVGCELSERVAGIVVVAGGFRSLPACHPVRPVSVLEIHGSNDASVPYGGDPEDHHAGAVRAWLAGWASRDRCAGTTPRRIVARRSVRTDWRACAPSVALSHIEVLGGGHQWPGATPPDPGPPSTFSAAQQAWAFLAPLRARRAG
jgi:polyhydroxybutyrate depolymerase